MALWRGRDVKVLITTTTNAATAAAFDSTIDYAGYFENVTFKEPEKGTGETKLLGSTNGNANSDVYEEDPSMSELTGDLVLTPVSGASVDIASLFLTFTGTAAKIANYAQDSLNPSIMIKFGNNTDYVGFIMSGVNLNNLGGVSVESNGNAKASGFKVSAAANQTYIVLGGTYT